VLSFCIADLAEEKGGGTLAGSTSQNLILHPALLLSDHGLILDGLGHFHLQLLVNFEDFAADAIGHLLHLPTCDRARQIAVSLGPAQKVAQGAPVDALSRKVLVCVQLRDSDWVG